MSRVDPLELLKAIAPMLGHSGNIKSTQEVEKVISLMKETSKLPGRCVYLSILRATSHRDVLELFVQRGGWNVLNEWLQDFRQAENMPSMRELLRLFKDMPVSVDVLKQNNTPKIVNKLTKGDDEDVKILALAVVQTWMNIVKGVSNGPSSAAPEKKISESKSSKDKSKSQSDKKLGERHKGSSKSSTSDKHRTSDKSRTHNSEKQKDKSKPSSKGSSEKKKEKTSELEDVKPLPEPKVEPKKPVRDRPKTVKTFHARFRSTGLEEEANTAVTKKQDKKRPSESDLSKLFVPSDKKIKPANLITPYEAPKTSNGSAEPSPTKKTPPREDAKIKLIPAKPKPIILESTGFMDALSTPISAPIRRKRKPSTQDVKKPTASPTASIPKVPSFYKDTMEETTEPDQKKPKNDEGEAEEEMEETAAGDKGDFGTTNENSSESSKLEGPVSVLSDVCKKKKCKKSVSWAEETELRNYHYFEMNDDERVNVNKAGTFMDLKHQDMQRERKALDSAKRILLEDKMQEQISWRLPPLISGMSFVLVDRGCNSTERELQAQRETQVLASLYFSKDAIPLSPLEPDPSREEQVDPIVVPLDDCRNLSRCTRPTRRMARYEPLR
ncbi:PREDICTED: serine/threonine-protein phosphatase 1 regulatory subunit 10-like isoform X1 [Priapulus caudatus]|uniref:Serine/threonine-protein phosphatase 1 regulatory subunit 10-like isoform X1 n=1 Tax=Priapulus caudatus TaxID=37621 RepID=A0ABM1EP18_PRICU|nr:PREDICTED: serine/threonine-protein phosphatase 1 regulatory subunit 10-like isoform X1 [Priapulus caudatus]XP_014673940.1 PREDICTED: serine/threonine-protein phosphatase 1 regulatory subunit 10-like isoform X1 [Priapulus caudatus]